MKLGSSSVALAACLSSVGAFAPLSRGVIKRDVSVFMAEGKTPFFAQQQESKSAAATPGDQTLEEEVADLTNQEMKKMKRASNLRNANGVDYAPWMNISADDETKIKQMMKEKAEARRKRQEQEKSVSGALLMDSQAQELSGGGLQTKVIGDSEIELSWTTSSEANTKGFMVKRRPARSEDFDVVASYEDWGPLASKGPDGGSYSFLDDSVSPGGWVYRVTECEANGIENDICQALVEVQTKEEQRGAVIAAVSIGVLLVGAVAAGVILDPVGGY